MIEQILANPKELVFIQSRVETNLDLVNEYAALMHEGVQFDAAQGVRDETGTIFIYDGLHRGEAAKLAEIGLLVELQTGTRQDAEWLALTANQKHGLRRTNQDKQRVVRQALLHPYGVQLSNREIARHCGVSDKTVGTIRREMEASAKISQIDKRIIQRGGTTYEQDTANIGSTKPAYAPVWKLEAAIRQWLDETFDDVTEQLQALTNIKDKTPEGQRQLSRLLSDNILPSLWRKGDVIQACHNVLDQLLSTPQSLHPDLTTLESSAGTWAYEVREPNSNGKLNIQVATNPPQPEYKPQLQEFECPRCRQEKIVGVNGSQRWCLNCGAEWPTAVEFLAEVNAAQDQAGTGLTRTELQQRFLNILTNLEKQPEQLIQVEIWLTELERQLGLATNLHLAGQAVAPILSSYSIPIQEYA